MASPATSYVKGIHQKFDFYAAWPVNQPRRLGDVGRLTDGQFQRLTSLADLGRIAPIGGRATTAKAG